MFLAPRIIEQIPDISQLYDINEKQSTKLDEDLEKLWNDIFLSIMEENKISAYEEMLGITPMATDTLEERRIRVTSKVFEKLPYSYNVILRKLKAISENDFLFVVDTDEEVVYCKVALTSKKMVDYVLEMLEAIIPLNMVIKIQLKYNTYKILSSNTHRALSAHTYEGVRDEVI